jgi:hypothetical protein
MPTSEWPTDEQWERVITGYDPSEVETVARALHAAAEADHERSLAIQWWELGDEGRAFRYASARAAIAALDQHRGGGEG